MSHNCSLLEVSAAGCPALRLANGIVSLTVIPSLGGKISSLVHLASQREWLSGNPRLAHRPATADSSFVAEHDSGGIDECFPGVAAEYYLSEPWRGTRIPDHGELWFQPWQVVGKTVRPELVSVTLACHGLRFPYRFQRTIELRRVESHIDLQYQVTNLSAYAFPYTWCIHPLLAIEPGMRIDLPAGVNQVRLFSSTDPRFGAAGSMLDWPEMLSTSGAAVDLGLVPSPDSGWAAKLFTLPIQGYGHQVTSITTGDGQHQFRFEFDAEEVPQVALWQNYGVWAGDGGEPYYNLGFEPTIGGSDSLQQAIEKLDEYRVLEPRDSEAWRLRIRLT